MPLAVFHGNGATGNNEVDVRVVMQLAAPSVKHPEETGDITADEFFIAGEFFQGLGRGFEHCGIGGTLVAADEASQLLGYRERDHEMVAGQLPLHLLFQPLLRLVVLAYRAVAIPA